MQTISLVMYINGIGFTVEDGNALNVWKFQNLHIILGVGTDAACPGVLHNKPFQFVCKGAAFMYGCHHFLVFGFVDNQLEFIVFTFCICIAA